MPQPSCRGTLVSRDVRGSVLILTIWSISLLSILAMSLGSRGAFTLGMTDRLSHQLRASYIAVAGVHHALRILAGDPTPSFDGPNETWANDPTSFLRQPIGDGTFTIGPLPVEGLDAVSPATYGLVDEERKLNLNTVPPEVVQRLVRIAGDLGDSDAAAISDAIQDWRDEDQEPGGAGAEDFYYGGLDPPYESKDSDFENLEELLLVKGVTPDLLARLAPYLTVHGSGQVNLNTATPMVLRALGLSEQGVDGIVWYRAGEDNAEGTADDRALTSTTAIASELEKIIPAEDVNQLVQLSRKGLLSVSSEAFSLSIVAETAKALSRTHLNCVVDRDGQITAWTEQ